MENSIGPKRVIDVGSPLHETETKIFWCVLYSVCPTIRPSVFLVQMDGVGHTECFLCVRLSQSKTMKIGDQPISSISRNSMKVSMGFTE